MSTLAADPTFRSLRVTTFLGTLLICSQALLVTSVGFAVEREARIRATVAAGETVVSAIRSYHREHGQYPSGLDRLVPRYLTHLPDPAYGASTWDYETGLHDQSRNDERLAISLGGLAKADRAAGSGNEPVFALSVRLYPGNPEVRFRRRGDGCWQLPEFPKCW